jgi:diguanylate cyclase (GGDEF)-like protein
MTTNDQVVLPSDQPDIGLLKRLSRVQVGCLAAVALIAVIVLGGWLDAGVAARLPNGWYLMKFNTALGMLLAAASLALSPTNRYAFRLWGSRVLALLVVVLASVAIFEHARGRLTGFDTWVANDATSGKPGLMALQTGTYLLFLGVWLLCIGARKGAVGHFVDGLTACLMLITLIIFSGYCFDAVELFGQNMSTRTSPHTLVCMVLLTAVLMGRRTRHGYFSVFVGLGIGSQLARKVLPIALLQPFVLVLAGIYVAKLGWLLPSVAAGLTVAIIAATLVMLVSLMATRINHLQRDLQELSLTDELTGIYNYRGFVLLGEQALREARRSQSSLTVLVFDLDDLKSVNDRFGHDVGSKFVLDVAQLLRENFKSADILARIGGDEFVVITKGEDAEGYLALTRVGEIAEAMNQAGDRPYKISFSVGEAISDPSSNQALSDLVARADRMMYERKRARRLFDQETVSQ